MKEYISKDRVRQFVCGHCNEVCSEEPCEPRDCDWMAFIDKEPAADVAEVRHGRWICINKRYGEYECSVCHGMDSNCSDYYGIHAVTEQEFCPSCGAKMDKEVADVTCICQAWAEQT